MGSTPALGTGAHRGRRRARTLSQEGRERRSSEQRGNRHWPGFETPAGSPRGAATLTSAELETLRAAIAPEAVCEATNEASDTCPSASTGSSPECTPAPAATFVPGGQCTSHAQCSHFQYCAGFAGLGSECVDCGNYVYEGAPCNALASAGGCDSNHHTF